MKEIDKLLWEEFKKKVPDTNIIEKIISEGGDINSIDDSKDTLLSDFLEDISYQVNYYEEDENSDLIPFSNNLPDKDDEEKLKLLFKYGINPNIYKEDSYSCLYDACVICLPEYVKILLENGARPNIKIAEEENFIDEMKMWICDDNDYRIVEDAIDRNKNMDIIIDMLKEYNIK